MEVGEGGDNLYDLRITNISSLEGPKGDKKGGTSRGRLYNSYYITVSNNNTIA